MRTIMVFMTGIVLLAGCTAAPTTAGTAQTISPADARFCYEGRFDFSDSNLPVVIWQASRISIDFEGDTLTMLFDGAEGQNYFNAKVDGTTTIVEANEGMATKGARIAGLGKGRHHLVLFKRSEANAGSVHFRGVQIAAGAKVWKPKPIAYKLKMEFIGDSKTVGACNEDGDTDQWDNRRTHNSALSYAALASEEFKADHRNISVSGMGVAIGWEEVKAGEMWNRLYPKANSPLADLSEWTPDIVFVNICANDESFTRVHKLPFPENFSDAYVSLVRTIRASYPRAHIVLLKGGTYGGMQSALLNKVWKAAVAQLETNDKDISHFIFKYKAKNHPRVAEDRILADELISWLKQQDFMQPYL